MILNRELLNNYAKYSFFLDFVFQGSKLTLENLLMIYYFFSQDIPIYLAERMYSNVSHTSYVKWYSKFRSCAAQNILRSDHFLNGNVETTIQCGEEFEIDESCFGKKRKYNKGAATKKLWIFGLMQRGTRNTVFRIVHKRDRDTLLPIIRTYVRRGSVIHSDDWKAYSSLNSEGYIHKVVVHKEEFVSREGACTNAIEG